MIVQGVRNDSGEVRFALYDRASEFPRGKRYDGTEVAAQKGDVRATFTDLPPGIYAAAVHHDENSNNEMDLRFGMLPLEGYGFSNNARVIVVPPVFEAAAFGVSSVPVTIRFDMVY